MMAGPASVGAGHWVIVYVAVVSALVDADWSTSAGARVTWSPDTELQHLAVDPVSGKVIYITVCALDSVPNSVGAKAISGTSGR